MEEFSIIEHLIKDFPLAKIKLENGDDAAVFYSDQNLVCSVDMYQEGVHFRFDYSDYSIVGSKVIEASFSDIVAMGAVPRFALVSIALPRNFPLENTRAIYHGVYQSLTRLGASLIGGDTISSNSDLVTLNITTLGERSDTVKCSRNAARTGDLIYLSSCTGLSAAGLKALQLKASPYKALIAKHTSPHCRSDLVTRLSVIANGMIDISDGLSSELWHIANASKLCLKIDYDRLPIHSELQAFCDEYKLDLKDFVLNGGEDYELLYTVAGEYSRDVPGYMIGEVVEGSGVRIVSEYGEHELPAGGWSHF